MRQGLRIVGRTKKGWRAIRLQRFPGDNPCRDRGSKVLGEKWTEWLILPRLDVTRRPVVDETNSEEMLFGILEWHRLPQFRPTTNVKANFGFVIEHLCRPEGWCGRTAGHALPFWPRDISAADNNRRRASVIRDGDVLVVREKRIIRTKDLADIRGVIDRRIEVGVVADLRRYKHLGLGHRNERPRRERIADAGVARSSGQ